jgi:hypothetical protein
MLALPPAPRGLLAEHGKFIEVTDTKVRIGLKNSTFKNIAESKRDDITKSCEKVFNRPIQVVFEAIGSKTIAKKTIPASPSAVLPTPTPQTQSSDRTDRSGQAQGSAPTPLQPPTPNPQPPTPFSLRSPEEQAIQNIAEFFGGQIINLDSEPDSSPEAS